MGKARTNISDISLQENGRYIGICAQDNILHDRLTVEENLVFIGKLKGLRKDDISENVRLVIEMMDLEGFRKIKACNLSGGNKRKLCCALSLILCP